MNRLWRYEIRSETVDRPPRNPVLAGVNPRFGPGIHHREAIRVVGVTLRALEVGGSSESRRRHRSICGRSDGLSATNGQRAV